MKKCPTCDKTFEDSMRFCQVDGTLLVDDAPAFDPYATIVSSPKPSAPVAEPLNEVVEPAVEATGSEPAAEVAEPAFEVIEPEPIADMAPPEPVEIPAAAPITEPDDVLDLPANDPLKTVFVSDAEMRDALGGTAPAAEEPVMELPPAEESAAEEYASPVLPNFSVPDVPAPSFGDAAPPPSPFSDVDPVTAESGPEPAPPVFEEPAPTPVFEEPAPEFDEAATIIQPHVSFDPPTPTPAQFDTPVAAPVAEWTPPPAPDANWQNQEIGSNTPFQPPPTGTGSVNQTLPIVSLVLGILSICCPLGAVTGPAALVTGFLGMKNVNNDPENYGGKGLAIAGMAVGGLFFILSVVWWILQIIGVGLSSMNRF